jgi:hypothetical protein
MANCGGEVRKHLHPRVALLPIFSIIKAKLSNELKDRFNFSNGFHAGKEMILLA